MKNKNSFGVGCLGVVEWWWITKHFFFDPALSGFSLRIYE